MKIELFPKRKRRREKKNKTEKYMYPPEEDVLIQIAKVNYRSNAGRQVIKIKLVSSRMRWHYIIKENINEPILDEQTVGWFLMQYTDRYKPVIDFVQYILKLMREDKHFKYSRELNFVYKIKRTE